VVVLGKPGTLSITGSLFIGVNAVAFVVGVGAGGKRVWCREIEHELMEVEL